MSYAEMLADGVLEWEDEESVGEDGWDDETIYVARVSDLPGRSGRGELVVSRVLEESLY